MAESVDINTKKGKDILCEAILSEIIRLNREGYSQEVILEQFNLFDTLKGFFSGSVVDGVMGYFKEYAFKYMLGFLGIDKNHWIADSLAIGFGNLPLGDIPKLLTDCDFATEWFSKSFIESLTKQFAKRTMKVDNPMANITRNVLIDLFDDTRLGEIVETALGKYICPMIGKMSGKMKNVTDLLKKRGSDTSLTKEKPSIAPSETSPSEKGTETPMPAPSET